MTPLATPTNWFVVWDINPIPWKVPDQIIARRGKKSFCQGVKHPDLEGYQDMLHTHVSTMWPEHFDPENPYVGDLAVEFAFVRNLAPYVRSDGRTGRARRCDATNLQKSTEDALEGLVFKDDKRNVQVTSSILQQAKDVRPMVAFRYSLPSLPAVEDFENARNCVPALIVPPVDGPIATHRIGAEEVF